MTKDDHSHLREAIRLAEQAEQKGNLPVGAVIVLDGEIVARGMNAIWQPSHDLTRHAEMEALHNLPPDLQHRYGEMTLYTTLEPCLMCAGAILLHRIERLVYGSADPYGGAVASFELLPTFFKEQLDRIRWEGPVLPNECDPLYKRLRELEGQ